MSFSNTIDPSVFELVDIRTAVITAVEVAEGCRAPAYRVTLDLGPEIGERISLAQATHYPSQALIGKQVLAVINLKPKQIGKHQSSALILGVPTQNQGTALIVPDFEAVLGARVF